MVLIQKSLCGCRGDFMSPKSPALKLKKSPQEYRKFNTNKTQNIICPLLAPYAIM